VKVRQAIRLTDGIDVLLGANTGGVEFVQNLEPTGKASCLVKPSGQQSISFLSPQLSSHTSRPKTLDQTIVRPTDAWKYEVFGNASRLR
jgi:hypothetical protein